MPEYHSILYPLDRDPSEPKRAVAAIAIFVALFSVLAFAHPHDQTKVVAGIPCSVLSEQDISAVLGTNMRLMPTSGTICQYVATSGGTSRTLFVVARHDATVPPSMVADGIPVHGVGDAALRTPNAVYVRYGSRSYTFDVIPRSPTDALPIGQELRLAKMMHRPMIAQNR